MNSVVEILVQYLPALATIAVVAALLFGANKLLSRRWKGNPEAQFRFQLIMLSLTAAGILSIIIALPINDTLRGQLLSLIGILLSAAIALSSTTFIGNILAGIMLKVIRSARPGDFITVADLTGRITEMDLLHTEIQTEFRDLVTVPNLYMVSQPLKVVRASGTIISADVSLGYDVSHNDIFRLLREAADRSGLTDTFVQVRELGDFSVVYRVAGLLEDVKSLISARSELQVAMLDALHSAGIEIVSPTFMNTRAVPADRNYIPKPTARRLKDPQTRAEAIIFDKADEAASIEEIRNAIVKIDLELDTLDSKNDDISNKEKEQLEFRKTYLTHRVALAEEQRKAAELAEKIKPRSEI